MSLGYYDKSKFKGEISWFPIVNKNLYQIAFEDMLIGGKSYGMCKNRNCTLALDSGTTFMSVPSYAMDIMVANKIPVGGKSQPCTNFDQWGNIEFVIGGKKFGIPPADYMFETFQSTIQVPTNQTGQTKEVKQTICPSAIMNLALHNNSFMVGDRFLRKYYTIFDRDNSRMGLAESVTQDEFNKALAQ